MNRPIQFTRQDSIHAALGVIPAVILILSGHLSAGIAFAIGLLPTSLLGIAPTRKLRLIYGLVGCLFGIGVFVGSRIVNFHTTLGTALIFIIVSYVATILAAKRPAGGLLLSLTIPSMAVGTGYTTTKAASLMLAFVAGSMWSSAVSMIAPEFPPAKDMQAKLQALQPKNPKQYGLLLGLTAATAIVIGHALNIPYPGWIATAAMLIMRPVQDMTGRRGIARAASTIVGTILVIITIQLGLSTLATTALVALVTILVIGGRTSRWYVTSFGTAFLILTIEMSNLPGTADISSIGWHRIINNVLGAAIALFFGLAIPKFLDQRKV